MSRSHKQLNSSVSQSIRFVGIQSMWCCLSFRVGTTKAPLSASRPCGITTHYNLTLREISAFSSDKPIAAVQRETKLPQVTEWLMGFLHLGQLLKDVHKLKFISTNLTSHHLALSLCWSLTSWEAFKSLTLQVAPGSGVFLTSFVLSYR